MTSYFVSPQEALRRVLGGLNNGDRMLWAPEIDVLRAALSHAEGEAVDREGLADALYLAGYSAARKERDYDPRGCDQWQAVVDAIRAHPAPQVAVPEDAILARGWYHHVSGDDYDIYDAKDENCDRCTEVAIVRADALTPTHEQE